jgi:hypothetical protein
MFVDEVCRFAVVLGRAGVVTASCRDHGQTFEAIVDLGIALEEVLSGVFGLVQSSGVDQIDHDVRRFVKAIVVGENLERHDGRLDLARLCSGALGRSGLLPRQTAALVFQSTAARTRIVAPDLDHRPSEAPLYTSLLTDATLFEALIAIDQDLAAAAQASGCRRCPSGRLHHGDYPRKPRGGPAMLSAAYDRRTSFCCARCRKRLTPPSVRFLGRRVYLAAVVVLACVLRQGPTPWRVARLRDLLGVGADTLARWHRWWRHAFVRTAFWRMARGRFARPVDEADLPRDLLARFPGDAIAPVVAMLRFLTPLTTPSGTTLGEADA